MAKVASPAVAACPAMLEAPDPELREQGQEGKLLAHPHVGLAQSLAKVEVAWEGMVVLLVADSVHWQAFAAPQVVLGPGLEQRSRKRRNLLALIPSWADVVSSVVKASAHHCAADLADEAHDTVVTSLVHPPFSWVVAHSRRH